MGKVVPLFRKKLTGKALADKAQQAVEQGRIGPTHPALSRIIRDNVVNLDSQRNKDK